MARRGLRVCDLLDPASFREKAARVVDEKTVSRKAPTARTSIFPMK